LTATAFACLALAGPATAQSQPTATDLRLGLVAAVSLGCLYLSHKLHGFLAHHLAKNNVLAV
jgi:hypothetical protein